MGVSVREMRNGKRIQSDDEVMFVGKAEWESLKAEKKRIDEELELLLKQFDERVSLIRNSHKLGLVRKDGSLDYDKFVIYDSVNMGMSLADTKKRVFEANHQKDERAITAEYNRFTVKQGVRSGWGAGKTHQYLKAMGSAIELSVVERYVSEFRGNRGRQ